MKLFKKAIQKYKETREKKLDQRISSLSGKVEEEKKLAYKREKVEMLEKKLGKERGRGKSAGSSGLKALGSAINTAGQYAAGFAERETQGYNFGSAPPKPKGKSKKKKSSPSSSDDDLLFGGSGFNF